MIQFSMTNCLPKEFLRSKERLSDRPDLIKSFEQKHGIKRNTLIHAPVWLTEEWQIYFPIYAGDQDQFKPIGAIVYNDNFQQGTVMISRKNQWAFFGVKMPEKERDCIIARDPFEWMRLWQEWYEDVWVLPDLTNIPYMLKNWNQIIFMNLSEEDRVHFKGYMAMDYRFEEKYNGEDLGEITPSFISTHDNNFYTFTTPFMCGGKLCFHTSRNWKKVILDRDQRMYEIRYNRFEKWNYFIHPTEGMYPCNSQLVNGSGVITKVSARQMYDRLYAYITSKLVFLTKGQAATITAFLMYQWVSPHFPVPYNLQIHSTQYQWLVQIFDIIHPLTPRGMINKGDHNVSSCLFTDAPEIGKQNLAIMPHIYLTHEETSKSVTNFWWWLPLTLEYSAGNKMDNFLFKVSPRVDGIREMLFNFAIYFDPVIPTVATKFNYLAFIGMIVCQVYKTSPIYMRLIGRTIEEANSKLRMYKIHERPDRDLNNNIIEIWKKAPPSSRKSRTSSKRTVSKPKESTPEKSL